MYVFSSLIALPLYSVLLFVAGAYYNGGLYPGGYHIAGHEIEALQQENANLKKDTSALVALLNARCGIVGEFFPKQSMRETPAYSFH